MLKCDNSFYLNKKFKFWRKKLFSMKIDPFLYCLCSTFYLFVSTTYALKDLSLSFSEMCSLSANIYPIMLRSKKRLCKQLIDANPYHWTLLKQTIQIIYKYTYKFVDNDLTKRRDDRTQSMLMIMQKILWNWKKSNEM